MGTSPMKPRLILEKSLSAIVRIVSPFRGPRSGRLPLLWREHFDCCLESLRNTLRLAKVGAKGRRHFARNAARRSTRPLSELNLKSTQFALALFANGLNLCQFCRFGHARNCPGCTIFQLILNSKNKVTFSKVSN